MATVEALNAGDITKIGVIVIIVVVLIGVLLSIIITRLIARLVVLVVVVALAIFVWQQRGHVQDSFDKHTCDLNATFFGVHLDAPQSLKDACSSPTG